MMLHAQINADGTLTANFPQPLWGKQVIVSITEAEESESSWSKLSAVFKEADALEFPRRSHEEILRELRAFKETE